MESVSMKSGEFRISQIVEAATTAKKTRKVADKTAFEQIFEHSCRQISGKAINAYSLREEWLH